MNQSSTQDEAVRIVREIAVPAEKVYEAFIDPEQLVRWMGPADSKVSKVEVDPRIGGTCDIWVEREDAGVGSFHWEFVEMVPAEKLVFSFAFGGPGDEVDTHRSRMTLRFKSTGPGRTELTLVHDQLDPASPAKPDAIDSGWSQALGKLVSYLETGSAEAAS